MGARKPQSYYSAQFDATNEPGTCRWCGRDTHATFIDTDFDASPDPTYFCSQACAADFGENVARMGYQFEPKAPGLSVELAIDPERRA
jgi:hypothetical protein